MKLAMIANEGFHNALSKLLAEPLPLRTAFKLKGISKAVQDEFAKYEEVRQAALKKHGLKKKDGSLKLDERQNVMFNDDGMKAFSAEVADLTAMDVSVPTVKLSELGDNIKLTVVEIGLLDGVIVED